MSRRDHGVRGGWACSVAMRRSSGGALRAMRRVERHDCNARGLGLHEVEGVRLQQGRGEAWPSDL
jgi:hypothetical protein